MKFLLVILQYKLRAQNNGLSLVISDPFQYDQANSNLAQQIYCLFSMGRPMIVYNNIPTLNK